MGPGTVDIFDACHRVVFTTKDGSLRREYKWETRLVTDSEGKMVPQTLYYLQGIGTEFGPTQLANLLRVRLLDITGGSEHCGELQPPRSPVSKEVPPDGLTP